MSEELPATDFSRPSAPTIQDVAEGFRTRNLLEDGLLEAQIEEEKTRNANLFKDPLIGNILDNKYQILEVLGFGGMSVVYKARQEPVDRLVAVKTVKFRVDERPDIWRRFEREVKTLSKLSHPNVVSVYDCVVGSDGQPYVVMDYLKGVSLDQALLHGRMNLEQVYGVAAQICLGVGHAHRNEVIHRDIKPANIMLLDDTGSGGYRLDQHCQQVKVVDFGLAKLGEDSRKLTHSGELWGSPPYMSPEQIAGRECDNRTDIYSLACVVYEMATGKDPFWGANVYELLHCHMHSPPPPLARACPDGEFPIELEQVIGRAMAKDPDQRYSTMADFKDALEHACLHASGTKSVDHGDRKDSKDATRFWSYSDRLPESPKDARNSHLLPAALTLLMLVACVLFSVNAGRNIGGPRVRRYIPPQSVFENRMSPATLPSLKNPTASDRASGRRKHSRGGGLTHSASMLSMPGNQQKQSVKKTIKDSSPNSSAGSVDQSKFELLRRLKSSASQR